MAGERRPTPNNNGKEIANGLHRLTSVTIGVPNVKETAAYYSDFGLVPLAPSPTAQTVTENPIRRFATQDGGEQLRIVHSGRRRVVRVGVGIDDPDDLNRIAVNLTKLGVPVERDGHKLRAKDPGSEVTV